MRRDGEAVVLIIDDDPVLRLMMGEVLREAGYTTLVAESAEAGLERFERGVVDLILVDVMMPGISGFDACRRFRAHARGANIPIIVMTGREDGQAIVEAFNAGATDFITKPVTWGLLPYRVRYALRSSSLLAQATHSRNLLARSQRLAKMGSWEWTEASQRLEYSDELRRIHGDADDHAPADLGALLNDVHQDDLERVALALARARESAEPYAVEFRLVRSNGLVRRLFEQTDIQCDGDGDVIAIRGIRLDVTEQVEADQRIRLLANTDALTGLPNRTLFRELATTRLSNGDAARCALLFVRIDDFPRINAQLGPAIADQVLLAVSERLRLCTASDRSMEADRTLLARFGGGEFLVLLTDVAEASVALRVGEWMVRALQQPILVPPHPLDIVVTVGIALAPQDGDDLASLLNNAGAAAHAAMDADGASVRLYNDAMGVALRERMALQAELRTALTELELRLHYQPKYEIKTSRVCGAEALLRWQHPRLGLLGPDVFIALAEQSGLVVAITEWIVGEVSRQQAEWRQRGLLIVPIAINLAAASLQCGAIIGCVGDALREHQLEARWLDLEVTESSLMQDVERSRAVLADLKALGIRLSIDDFGVGYSSLSYLRQFPVDVLKIDRSFITALEAGSSDAKLTAAIIAMGLSLGLELVAEGVETPEQVEFLAERGCHVAQGFLYSRPLEADAFERMLIAR